MSFLDTVRIALRALLKNKMRAVLTIIGVVIGIAAVTTIVSIGQGASQLVSGEFEALGTNVVLVLPGQTRRGGVRQSGAPSLTAEDSNAIGQDCPAVLASSPIVGTGCRDCCPGLLCRRAARTRTALPRPAAAGGLVLRRVLGASCPADAGIPAVCAGARPAAGRDVPGVSRRQLCAGGGADGGKPPAWQGHKKAGIKIKDA